MKFLDTVYPQRCFQQPLAARLKKYADQCGVFFSFASDFFVSKLHRNPIFIPRLRRCSPPPSSQSIVPKLIRPPLAHQNELNVGTGRGGAVWQVKAFAVSFIFHVDLANGGIFRRNVPVQSTIFGARFTTAYKISVNIFIAEYKCIIK